MIGKNDPKSIFQNKPDGSGMIFNNVQAASTSEPKKFGIFENRGHMNLGGSQTIFGMGSIKLNEPNINDTEMDSMGDNIHNIPSLDNIHTPTNETLNNNFPEELTNAPTAIHTTPTITPINIRFNTHLIATDLIR